MSPNPLRKIPSVSELLENPSLRSLVERINHSTLASAARTVLDELRNEVQTVASERTLPDVSELAERIASRIMESTPPRMRSMVNATGVLFHPELGRPPLPDPAVEAMAAVARGFVDESHLGGRNRIYRQEMVEKLLRDLTSAERAVAVNNIAAATTLALAAAGADGDLRGVKLDEQGKMLLDGRLIVARDHLLDFGGEYRISDLTVAAGVWLNETGAANATRIEDYAKAIGEGDAAVLYVVSEFGGCPALGEVIELAHSRKVPVIVHVDGGSLIDGASIGLPHATNVRDVVAAGADLVVFRGDRLVGGPQCGLIVGKNSLVENIEQHPLAGAGRMDDAASAALAATLQLYSDAERARHSIPLLQQLGASVDNLKNRAERLAPQLSACDVVQSAVATQGTASLHEHDAAGNRLASWRIEIEPAKKQDACQDGGRLTAQQLAEELMRGEPGVAAKIEGERLVIDLRSVIPWQDIELVAAFEAMDDEGENVAVHG